MQLDSILVTGAASHLGRGLARILNGLPWINNVYGMDIRDQFPTTHFYKDFVRGLRVDEAGYLEFLINMINQFKVELIIPMSETEIRFFNEKRIDEINNVPLLIPSFNIMSLGFDKFQTAKFLEENKYPFPWTMLVNQGQPLETPCIMKSRNGSGSKDINIVTKENLEFYKQGRGNWIYQELLLPNEEEYTCGIFRSKKGETKMILLKRKLSYGRTGYAEVIQNAEIINLLHEISNKINFQGSINVQLRMTKKGPVIFEINPRFSSTLVFRHKLGFRDVEWAILDKFNQLNDFTFNDKEIIGKKIFLSEEEIIY